VQLEEVVVEDGTCVVFVADCLEGSLYSSDVLVSKFPGEIFGFKIVAQHQLAEDSELFDPGLSHLVRVLSIQHLLECSQESLAHFLEVGLLQPHHIIKTSIYLEVLPQCVQVLLVCHTEVDHLDEILKIPYKRLAALLALFQGLGGAEETLELSDHSLEEEFTHLLDLVLHLEDLPGMLYVLNMVDEGVEGVLGLSIVIFEEHHVCIWVQRLKSTSDSDLIGVFLVRHIFLLAILFEASTHGSFHFLLAIIGFIREWNVVGMELRQSSLDWRPCALCSWFEVQFSDLVFLFIIRDVGVFSLAEEALTDIHINDFDSLAGLRLCR